MRKMKISRVKFFRSDNWEIGKKFIKCLNVFSAHFLSHWIHSFLLLIFYFYLLHSYSEWRWMRMAGVWAQIENECGGGKRNSFGVNLKRNERKMLMRFRLKITHLRVELNGQWMWSILLPEGCYFEYISNIHFNLTHLVMG